MTLEARQQTERLYEIYQEGNHSVRQLAKVHKIPFTTLRDRFQRLEGKEYTLQKAGEGTIHGIIQEYLHKPMGKQSQVLKSWYRQNKQKIIAISYEHQKLGKPKIYTESKIQRECIARTMKTMDLGDCYFLSHSY